MLLIRTPKYDKSGLSECPTTGPGCPSMPHYNKGKVTEMLIQGLSVDSNGEPGIEVTSYSGAAGLFVLSGFPVPIIRP